MANEEETKLIDPDKTETFWWVIITEQIWTSDAILELRQNVQDGNAIVLAFIDCIMATKNKEGKFERVFMGKTRPLSIENIAREIMQEVSFTRTAINYLVEMGLMSFKNGTYCVNDFENFIGSKSKAALRMAKARENKKRTNVRTNDEQMCEQMMNKCSNIVTQEKEIEKELNIELELELETLMKMDEINNDNLHTRACAKIVRFLISNDFTDKDTLKPIYNNLLKELSRHRFDEFALPTDSDIDSILETTFEKYNLRKRLIKNPLMWSIKTIMSDLFQYAIDLPQNSDAKSELDRIIKMNWLED